MTATQSVVGMTLPSLSLPTLDGETVEFDQLRGKRYLLFFWGSW